MDRHGTARTLWRAAHALGAAGLFALAAVLAASLPARAQPDPAPAALPAFCTTTGQPACAGPISFVFPMTRDAPAD